MLKILLVSLILSIQHATELSKSVPKVEGPLFFLNRLPVVVPVKIVIPGLNEQPPWSRFEVVPPLSPNFNPRSLKDLR